MTDKNKTDSGNNKNNQSKPQGVSKKIFVKDSAPVPTFEAAPPPKPKK